MSMGRYNVRMTTFRLNVSVKIDPSTHHPTDLFFIEAAKSIEEIKSRAI